MTGPFVRYLGAKAARAVLTIWLVVTFVFLALRAAGDPARILLGQDATDAMVADYRDKMGLNGSLLEQYASYLAAAIRGDFETSFLFRRDAMDVVLEHLPQTVCLSLLALTLAIAVGGCLGIAAATNRGGRVDAAVQGVSMVGYAIPNYFLAVVLVLVFSETLGWLPAAGAGRPGHVVLPAVALAAPNAAMIARFLRSSMIEALESRYIAAARSRRVPEWRIVLLHALPNAAIPVLTVVGLMVGGLIGGAIIIETIFSWPGVGRLFFSSVVARDIPVVQAIVLLAGAMMVLANLAVDVCYGWLDPRIRLRAGPG